MIDKISGSRSELSGVSEALFDYMHELKEGHGLRVTPCTDFSNNIREFVISDGFRIIHSYPSYTRPGIKRELVLVVNPDVTEEKDTILECPERYTKSIHIFMTSSKRFCDEAVSAEAKEKSRKIIKEMYEREKRMYSPPGPSGQQERTCSAGQGRTCDVLDDLVITVDDSDFDATPEDLACGYLKDGPKGQQ